MVSTASDVYEKVSCFYLLTLGLGLNYSFVFSCKVKTADEIIVKWRLFKSGAHGHFLISGGQSFISDTQCDNFSV